MNFIISNVLVFSKHDKNELPLIDCIPTPDMDIFLDGVFIVFFSLFYDMFSDYYLILKVRLSKNTIVYSWKFKCSSFFLIEFRHL